MRGKLKLARLLYRARFVRFTSNFRNVFSRRREKLEVEIISVSVSLSLSHESKVYSTLFTRLLRISGIKYLESDEVRIIIPPTLEVRAKSSGAR